MDRADLAISYMLYAYVGGTLALAALGALFAAVRGQVQARRLVQLAREPSPEVAKVLEEVDGAIQTAEFELHGLPVRPGAERQLRERYALEELARVDALYQRLGALRAPGRASYRPAIARLHGLAARSGLHARHAGG